MFCQVLPLSDWILTVRLTAGSPPMVNRPRTRNCSPLLGVVFDGLAVMDTAGAIGADAASAEAFVPMRAPLATMPLAITVVRPRRMKARRVDMTVIGSSE